MARFSDYVIISRWMMMMSEACHDLTLNSKKDSDDDTRWLGENYAIEEICIQFMDICMDFKMKSTRTQLKLTVIFFEKICKVHDIL